MWPSGRACLRLEIKLGGEGGVIIYGNDGKPSEILINEEVADATTLPHEVWHGLLFIAFGEIEQLFKKFKDDITTILNEYYKEYYIKKTDLDYFKG